MLRAIIYGQGSHFCNRSLASLLQKYGVVNRVVIAYHPQTNGQAEVFNREIKQVLLKVVQPNRKNWSKLLEEALRAHKTAYQTLLGMSPNRVVFGKACHLLVETAHLAYWAVKGCNMAFDEAGMEKKLQLL